jgi:hypothetical protein
MAIESVKSDKARRCLCLATLNHATSANIGIPRHGRNGASRSSARRAGSCHLRSDSN